MAEPNTPPESVLNFQSSLLRLADLSQASQPDRKELAKQAEAIEALRREAASTTGRADA